PISFTRDPKSAKRQPRVKPISHKVTTPNNVNPVGVSNSTLAKRFSCQICGYSTDRSSHYNRHARTHSDERPFSCDACGKRFKIDTYLKKHRCSMRQLHPDNMALQNSHEIDAQNIETLKQPLGSHLNTHPQICMTCGLWLPDRMECSNHICQGPMPVLGSM
uniref:C2H2-type domain-containing protein n=1 Tax=Ciona savignyi TaxID=51511 RepID=H2Y547_CIOSA